MINNNYSNYNMQGGNISYGAVKDVMPEQINEKLPENLQNLDAKDVAKTNNSFAAAMGMDNKTIVASLPIYAAFIGLRSLNDIENPIFSFAGAYEKTTLGKLAKLGDMISKGVSKIIPDSIENGIANGVKNAKNWLLGHSALARSSTTPLRLEHSMAKSEASGLFGRVMNDTATHLFEKGYKGDLVKLLKGDGTGEFWKILESKGVEALSSEEARNLITTELNELTYLPTKSKHVQACVKDIVEKLSQSNEKVVVDKWAMPIIGRLPKVPIIGKAFKLEVPMSEIANKLRASAQLSGEGLKTGAAAAGVVGTTALGRMLPGAFAKIYEGITSDFVGGKIAPFMQAAFLTKAILRAKDAPEGKKLATFMDEETSAVTFLFTMPLATAIMTKTGGALKYLGMGKTKAQQALNVDKFRDMVKVLNERVDAQTISRGEYLKEVKNIKNFLKGDTKFYHKPLKFIGNILGANYKAETIKPFIGEASADMSAIKRLGLDMSNKVQKLLYNFKTGTKTLGFTPAGVLRFILVAFVLGPIVGKPITALVNKIFGKPYDPEAEKAEQEKAEQEAKLKNNPFATMSDDELLDLLQKNQSTLVELQNDPALMQELQNDPQKLYDLLKEGAAKKEEAMKNAQPSQLLQKYINNKSPNNGIQPQAPVVQPNLNNQNNLINTSSMNQNMNIYPNATMPAPSVQNNQTGQNTQPSSQEPSGQIQPQEPVRTYIPSSKPADFSKMQTAQDARFNALLADMDKTEKEYSQYLGI